MTHKDIYIKFMIEYDKANVTSSYPSLTEYEVATVLDKAYNALIAQKVTGNNVRRAPLESDIKSIEDLQPLIWSTSKDLTYKRNVNIAYCSIPSGDEENPDMLYFISARLEPIDQNPISQANPRPGTETLNQDSNNEDKTYPYVYDGFTERPIPLKLVSHEIADKFLISSSNMPWIKDPICFIENYTLNVVYDPVNRPQYSKVNITYIQQPEKFTKDLSAFSETTSYFYGPGGNVQFELDDAMAEELISLAISFALENVESPRLNTKLNMRGLES